MPENQQELETVAAPTGFDIAAQRETAKQEDEGVVVHIHGLDEKPLYFTNEHGETEPVTITTAGAHSTLYRREEERQRRRKLKPRQLTGEAIYDDNIEKSAACALGWRGFFSGPNVVPFTPHNVKEVYKHCPWVHEQVLEAMHDHQRFFRKESTQP